MGERINWISILDVVAKLAIGAVGVFATLHFGNLDQQREASRDKAAIEQREAAERQIRAADERELMRIFVEYAPKTGKIESLEGRSALELASYAAGRLEKEYGRPKFSQMIALPSETQVAAAVANNPAEAVAIRGAVTRAQEATGRSIAASPGATCVEPSVRQVPRVAANTYYRCALESFRSGDFPRAKSHAANAMDLAVRSQGGEAVQKYRSLFCLTAIRADDRDILLAKAGEVCSGNSEEDHLLQGLYWLAVLKSLPPNTAPGAQAIVRASEAFNYRDTTNSDSTPTFAELAPGVSLADLQAYGRAQSQACLGENASSGLSVDRRTAAATFFRAVGATCG